MSSVVSITPLALERDSRTFKQAASAARLGYPCTVVEGHPSSLDRDGLPFALCSLGVRQWHLRPMDALARRMGGLLTRIPGVAYALDHIVRYGIRTFLATPKAALYYLHAFNQFPAVWLRCWMHGARYVYDAHDFYSGIEEPRGLGWTHRRLRLPWERWLEARCVRHAAAVVTVSEGVAALQQRAFGCRSVIIRNCEDRRLQRPPARRLRETTGVGPAEFLFVVVGHAKRGQAIAELLDALTETPAPVHVALVGLGYERFAVEIRTRRLEGRIHAIPPVKPYEIVPFIADADASLLLYYPRSANYLYCLPNGFFQAIAAGLPLLYPALPEIRKIAAEYDLGLSIDPTSSASIADGMKAFFRQPDRVSAYRRNAERARGVLVWEREERVLAEVIERALHGPRTGEA